jgi:hypothetical protein
MQLHSSASHICFTLLSTVAANACASGFIEDSKISLTTRNYYFDRDFKKDSPYPAAREWAQGFIFKANSGYTPGVIGLGVDVTGMLGLQLDSSPEHTGTQMLPFNPQTRDAAHEFSELGVAVKARISKTDLAVGTLFPTLPILYSSSARLLIQSFRGAYVTSGDIPDITLHAGYIDRVNQRDSTDNQELSIGNPNGRFKPGQFSDKYTFAGAEYAFSPSLNVKYFHAELEDIYTQDHVGIIHTAPLGSGTLKSDFRFFDSRDSGLSKSGKVDNRNYGLMVTYQTGPHAFGLGYMYQTGDTAFAYLSGGEATTINEGSMSSDFVNPKERTAIARYDYNFAAMGVPGLKGMLRYMRGSNIDLPAMGGDNLTESSKDVELSYVIQSGPFSGLALRARHAFFRNDLSAAATMRSANETRINIDYTWKFK